jgi:hypothetical protein
LTQQAVKQNKGKKKHLNEDRDDDEEMEFMINNRSSQQSQSWKQADFVPFEDDENDNAGYAEQAEHAEHAGYDPADHDIDQEFLPEDFFDDMYDN